MNVFDIIPSDFFNCLSGISNSRVYADCLELILISILQLPGRGCSEIKDLISEV